MVEEVYVNNLLSDSFPITVLSLKALLDSWRIWLYEGLKLFFSIGPNDCLAINGYEFEIAFVTFVLRPELNTQCH